MNPNQQEIQLLRLMMDLCRQARSRGDASMAKVAIKHEERLSAQISKLEGTAKEPAEPAAA